MSKLYMKTLAIVAGAAIASGCSSMAADTTSVDSGSSAITAADLAASQQRISELESALAAKERDLANAEARIGEDDTEERMEWRQVMCEVNMTHDNVLALQKALADEGYYKAGLDGIIGGQTLSAARQYALDKNLPAGSNYVSIEVVKSLDLTL